MRRETSIVVDINKISCVRLAIMEQDNVIATEASHVTALRRAIDITGGQGALAAKLRQYFADNPSPKARTTVSQQTVSYWLNSGSLLDAVWWPAFEWATDNGVTRRDLRPDVFARENAA